MREQKILIELIWLLLRFLFFLSAIFLWLYFNDFSCAHVDDTIYFLKAYGLFNVFDYYGWSSEFLDALLTIRADKPPLLIYFLSTLIAWLSKFDAQAILLIAVLSMNTLLFFTMYLFCKRVLCGLKVFTWLIFIYTLAPLLFGVTKLLLVEALLLSFFLLFALLFFSFAPRPSWSKSFVLGLIYCLGLYTKITFLFYSLPFLFFIFAPDFLLRLATKLNALFKLELFDLDFCKSFNWRSSYKQAFVLALLPALPWYVYNLPRVMSKFIEAASYPRHVEGFIFSPLVIVNYAFDLLQAFGFALALLLFMLFMQNKQALFQELQARQALLWFALMPVLSFVFFFFISNKNERFQFVSLFVLALLLAILCAISRNNSLKFSMLVLQLVISVHYGFYQLFPALVNRVLYVTRPYSAFFSKELEGFLLNNFAQAKLCFKVKNSLVDKDIRVEFQNQKKNIRSLKYHFCLLQARAGYLPDNFRSNDVDYILSDSEILERTQVDYPLMLRVVPITKEPAGQIRDYNFGRVLLEDQENSIKYLIYEKI